ncbi:DUF2471 family protein [Achromobacter sp. UMC71]|uniref:DUF2471 family protein n=1 Tax=Achromobacter sp. UMC71 TaxID=1862320 RepID=UPI001602839C|nr:DUF2471 family protein [Achromobacter sp. UMC71]MBB1625167.1 hypothetical protein [Achromobacter sp. UMC71]
MLDTLEDIKLAVDATLPAIIARHRVAGQLTWRLIHQIEGELMHTLAATGRYDPVMLRMVTASPWMGYPHTDEPVDFGDSNVRAMTFSAIEAAWALGR